MVARHRKRISLVSLSFAAVLVTSIAALVVQSFIYTETYSVINDLTAAVKHVAVKFSNDHVETNLTVALSNPSAFGTVTLKSVQIATTLNGRRLTYTSGSFFYAIEIPSKTANVVILRFRIAVPSEFEIYRSAQRDNHWSWYFDVSIIILVGFRQAKINASGPYEGVELSP